MGSVERNLETFAMVVGWQVSEEFYRQGDLERRLGLPGALLCDRHSSSVSKIQTGFFRFIAVPLFEQWHRFHATPLSHDMMRYLRSNQVAANSPIFLSTLAIISSAVVYLRSGGVFDAGAILRRSKELRTANASFS